MIGIRFKIPNEYDVFLNKILKGIDSKSFFWRIVEEEAYQVNADDSFDNSKDLFDEKWYTNKKFKELISAKSNYIIFLNLQLYNKKSNCEINKYDDFIKSPCMLIVLITDNIFVDVYSKNEELLKIVECNVITNDFEELQHIFENSDERKIFSAYE